MDHAGAGLRLTRADLEHYLSALSEKGRTASTLQTYRRSLELFYRHLPPGRSVSPGMLPAWQAQLLSAGYRPWSFWAAGILRSPISFPCRPWISRPLPVRSTCGCSRQPVRWEKSGLIC